MRSDSDRAGEARGLSSFLATERARVFDQASPERQAQMRAAEGARRVYEAWNAVCAGTREGSHVTGLRYLAESNELLVYLDGDTWVTEMTLLREIVRARMARLGVDVAGFVFKVSRPEYVDRSRARAHGAPAAHPRPPRRAPERTPLSAEEDAAIDASTSGIADDRLQEALRRAMKASFSTKVPKDGSTPE